MNGIDRFLIVVVVGALVLAGAVLALVLVRSGPSAYRADDSPEAVVENHLLACQSGDTARAYSNLSPDLAGYPPTIEAFEHDLRASRSRNSQSAQLTVLSSGGLGNMASLRVRETVYYNSGPLERGEYANEYRITLRRHAEGWKILEVDGFPSTLCWEACWQVVEGCP